jgi:hypothetical protein
MSAASITTEVGPAQCCFCGETILQETPLEISVALSDDAVQGFYAHSQCFKRLLHESVPFMTPAELGGDD